MSESIVFEPSSSTHIPATRTRGRGARLRGAMARRSIEQRREKQRLREHIREVWD